MSPSTILTRRSSSAVSASLANPATFLTPEKQDVVKKYVEVILNCYHTLATLSNLQPSVTVNKAFENLVSVCSEIPEEATVNAILKDPRVSSITCCLHDICSDGECKLEKYWAEQLISAGHSKNVTASLASFPYYENYVELAKMELGVISLASSHSPPRRFAFLGCGPLPLTSLCILDQLKEIKQQVSVLNIDHNPAAITAASKLCRCLNYPESLMSFLCNKADGCQTDLSDFDVVYVAALVGATSDEKREIFSAVLARMRPGALLVVRSAHALRTLLYPAVKVSTDLDPVLFEPIMVVHPYNHIVNSVIIGRVRESKVL